MGGLVGACSGSGFTSPIDTTLGGEADAGELELDASEPIATDAAALACKPSRADCNKKASDGCEVDTSSNAKNCGACGKACKAGEVCAVGKCDDKCPANLSTCGSSCVDTAISVDHCGGCNKPCAAPSNATALCESSQCTFQCNANYEPCASGCCEKVPPPPLPILQPGAALSAGGNHTCAIVTGGGLKCWGSNGSGKLGDNTMTDRKTATKVSGLVSGVSAVGCGDIHTCAMLATGEVRCWGGNTLGQLGTGDNFNTTLKVPNTVSGLSADALALAVGKDFSCAIVTGGGVKCWGDNAYGQLGDGTTLDSDVPVDVIGLAQPAKVIAAGTQHVCALLGDGSMACWGANDRGQLGDGSTDHQTTPVTVANLPAGVLNVSAGFSHTCARTSANQVICWGSNTSGQLGNGTTTSSGSPVQSNVSDVSAFDLGSNHSCAVTNSGGASCWGSNFQGQLGDGTVDSASTPVSVINVSPALLVDIAGGASHTCARTQGDAIKCWGANSRGQLGNGTTNATATPVNVQGL